jgi:ABC-type nitrate/sulfonate/bicarbonate transport system ATPase subunit
LQKTARELKCLGLLVSNEADHLAPKRISGCRRIRVYIVRATILESNPFPGELAS